MLNAVLIAFSVVIVLGILAAVIAFAFAAPGVFFTLLALLAGYFGSAYWEAAREARRAAEERSGAGKIRGKTLGSP